MTRVLPKGSAAARWPSTRQGGVDVLEDRFGEPTVLADVLDLKHAAIGTEGDRPQGRLYRRRPRPKSRVSLMLVSMREARSSSKYCLMRVDVVETRRTVGTRLSELAICTGAAAGALVIPLPP